MDKRRYSRLSEKKGPGSCKDRSLQHQMTQVSMLWLSAIFLFHALFIAAAITRDDFPSGFIFGAGTSAYQVEGAAAEDGRKPSVWDTFAHAGKNADKSTGDVAADQYHKYKEDVKLMHKLGLDAYRFSFSWSRLIPDGRGPVNPKGLEYYNNLINELLKYDIEPHVTLHHFDLPQALEDEYGGVLNPRIIEDFTTYADICFWEFGDRVKYWTTFNEPNVEPLLGYCTGIFPPGHCVTSFANCFKKGSPREPFIFAHNVLLAHASAATLYKDKYQARQGGKIGLNVAAPWFEPSTDSPNDVAMTDKRKELVLGWILNPLVYGTYSAALKDTLGSKLPSLMPDDSIRLKASYDFIGLNHYTAYKVGGISNSSSINEIRASKQIPTKFSRELLNKVPAAVKMPLGQNDPGALQKLLEYVKEKYGNPPVMIHENGYGENDIDPTSSENSANDDTRAYYLKEYTRSLLQAIRNGSNTLAYFVWSLIDCFELDTGYTSRYGIYGVDFSQANKRRFPRLSAKWYSSFLKSNSSKISASSVTLC